MWLSSRTEVVLFCSILSLILATILRAGARADEIAGDAETAEGVVVANRVANACAAVNGAGVFEENEDGAATNGSTRASASAE